MTLILMGAGGHAREIADIAQSAGISRAEIVFFAEAEHFAAEQQNRLRVRGFTVTTRLPESPTAVWLLAVGSPALRVRFIDQAMETSHSLGTLVSPHAVMSPFAELQSGVVIFPHAMVSADVLLSEHVHVNQSVRVSHDVIVGSRTVLGPGAVLTGGVRVDQDVVIGAAAVVMPGRHVAAGAQVGAGAVVVHDVEPGTTVVGNPARVLPPRG